MASIIREWLYNSLNEEEMEAVLQYEDGSGPLPELAWETIQQRFAQLRIPGKTFTCNVELQSGKRKGQLCDRQMRILLLSPGWNKSKMVNMHCGCNYHECYAPVCKRIQELQEEEASKGPGKVLLQSTAAPPTE